MKQTFVIVANGELSDIFLGEIHKSDVVVGVDRGALWLLAHGVVPSVAIGDFDSVSSEEMKTIKQNVKQIIRYPSHKDVTDLELAADFVIKKKARRAVIFGGTGKRMDHTIAMIHVLQKLLVHSVETMAKDRRNETFLVKESRTILKSPDFPYVSFFPVTNQACLTLNGFLYDVKQQDFFQGQTLGVSNEVLNGSADITVHRGIFLVIRSRD